MTIGLTGATGFIGARLLPLLAEHTLRLTTLPGEAAKAAGELIPTDLVSGSPDAAFYHDLDVLVHMVGSFSTDPRTLSTLNLATLMNALRPLEALEGKPHVVFTSSCAVYGETPEGRASQEDDPLEPSTPYGFAKKWGEEYLTWHAKRHGYTATILRFPNVYGQGSQAVMAKFIDRLLADQPVVLEGDGEQVRDFLAASDAARGIVAAIETRKPGTFNIATGRGTSLRELLALLERITGRTANIEEHPVNPFTQKRSVLDPARARKELGWEAAIHLREGIEGLLHVV